MENKITINVPDGYEIDKENSTFDNIKLKKVEDHKFSKGDIIVDGYGNVRGVLDAVDNGKEYHLYDVKTKYNDTIIDYDKGDKNFRKWSINDAKIGELLYNKKTNTVFFYVNHTEKNGILQIDCIVPYGRGHFYASKRYADPNDIETAVYGVLFRFLENTYKIQHFYS